MQVNEVMSHPVRIADPTDTLQQAAELMAELDAGSLPVGENDRLVGMLTDRDIAIRGAARGRDPTRTTVREVMTKEILYCFDDEDIDQVADNYCFDDEDIDQVADNMAMQQIRRLPVLNREKRLIGIVSLGDLARRTQSQTTGDTLRGVCQVGGQHSQTLH